MTAPRWTLPLSCLLLALLAGCAARTRAPSLALPDSTAIVSGPTGAAVSASELMRRVGAADIVLLGEVHDNAVHHEVRGAMLNAFASLRPAVVFEQIPAATGALAPPAPGEATEAWLDRVGFDRRGWRWPLHRPAFEAALAHGRSLWGSGVSRERLRDVVRGGEAAAPEPFRGIMERAPLDSTARAALDQDLIDGHCGRLPASQVPGMRAAQVVRDAAMTAALMDAAADGPAWLLAGNGHVRREVAVPRLLRVAAPGKRVLIVGFLERNPDGSTPAAERLQYDIVILTPRAVRDDPCRSL